MSEHDHDVDAQLRDPPPRVWRPDPVKAGYEYSVIPNGVIRRRRRVLVDGVPCEHPGCFGHVSHPCEGCGRIAGVSQR